MIITAVINSYHLLSSSCIPGTLISAWHWILTASFEEDTVNPLGNVVLKGLNDLSEVTQLINNSQNLNPDSWVLNCIIVYITENIFQEGCKIILSYLPLWPVISCDPFRRLFYSPLALQDGSLGGLQVLCPGLYLLAESESSTRAHSQLLITFFTSRPVPQSVPSGWLSLKWIGNYVKTICQVTHFVL